MPIKVIEARVIRWEASIDQWGVAVRYDDRTRASYPVGDRAAAEAEVIKLKRSAAPLRSVDGKSLIWGEVRELALRERAMRAEIKTSLEKRALFERYRQILEGLVSELFDEGKLTRDKLLGVLVVRVPNGKL